MHMTSIILILQSDKYIVENELDVSIISISIHYTIMLLLRESAENMRAGRFVAVIRRVSL